MLRAYGIHLGPSNLLGGKPGVRAWAPNWDLMETSPHPIYKHIGASVKTLSVPGPPMESSILS